MAQRQFRTDDTSVFTDRFGTGSDDAYAPSTGTDAPIDSACTGTISTTSLTATNGSFAAGQLILIHQTQGTGAGQWELNKIASYVAGTITTAYSLIYGYTTGAQVLVMPQYSSGNIAGGVTLTAKAWDGSVGGIYAKFCNGTFTIAGILTGVGKGYRVGQTDLTSEHSGQQGESTGGVGTESNAANNTGGGGGGFLAAGDNKAGGGGGSYATAGTDGTKGAGSPPSENIGVGATTTIGAAALTTLFFGGGGGGGGYGGTTGPVITGSGGSIVLLITKTLVLSGNIKASGENGADSFAAHGANGAGSGGSILIKAQTATLGTALALSIGGTGGAAIGNNGGGGNGGTGRVHIDYSTSLSGTTNPTLDSSIDAIFVDQQSGFFMMF